MQFRLRKNDPESYQKQANHLQSQSFLWESLVWFYLVLRMV